jgi:hypothetical protein
VLVNAQADALWFESFRAGHIYEESMNMIGKVCVVRAQSAGVFFGIVSERNGSEVVMENARRLWYWDGAASLSQLANEGVSKPGSCKFPAPVAEILVMGVIEIIPATQVAIESIEKVPEWRE